MARAATRLLPLPTLVPRGYYSCKVAADSHGDFFLNDIRDAGVDSGFDAERDGGITGKCLVLISPDAERSMNTHLGISAELSVKELNEAALASGLITMRQDGLRKASEGKTTLSEILSITAKA